MILVYSKSISSRLQYILNLIFKEVLDIAFEATDDYDKFIRSDEIRINYSDKKIENIFQIIPSGLLEEKGIRELSFQSDKWKDIPTLFANIHSDLPFDLFSAAFFLVTRYEEYLPYQPDKHGRFEATQSLAWKNGFLHLPVVDLWCRQFAGELGIEKECKGIWPSNYRFQLTIDVDQAWYYKNKGFLRTTGGLIKNILKLDFSEFAKKMSVLAGYKNDPADAFNYLGSIREKLSGGIKYFILSGKRGQFDHNPSIHNKNFRKLIRELTVSDIVGIHPSYASYNSYNQLKNEYKNLSEIIQQKVRISRQHFLRLRMPATYRDLIKLGIEEDHTLGYGSQSGFRAGIARPFYFYDLIAEEQTNLLIVPFQVMDRTLLSYMKLTPDKAISEIDYYTKTIKEVGGLFVSLWHNDHLNNEGEWKGWKTVFEKMINQNADS
jgi:hypothetical protein